MSAFPEQPDGFIDWYRTQVDATVGPGDFLSRSTYADYLEATLRAELAGSRATCTHVTTSVTAIEAGYLLHCDDGSTVSADSVVLAIGNPPPELSWAPAALRDSRYLVGDPWAPGALQGLRETCDLLVVGSGLTMVDVALTLVRPGRTVHAISRHGLLPQAHLPTRAAAIPPPPALADACDLASMRSIVTAHLRDSVRASGDWRPAMDGLRPITADLWQRLSEACRQEFLVHDAAVWNAFRHRLPPASAERIAAAIRLGQLEVSADEVREAQPFEDHVTVTLRSGRELSVGTVLNCAGHNQRIRPALLSGHCRPGPLGLGIDTDEAGRVLTPAGCPQERLLTLGASRIGQLWETTAIPEIRGQAQALARRLSAVSGAPLAS